MDIKHRWWLLLGLSILVGLSFFARHVAGFVLLGTSYAPLVYDPRALRAEDSTAYFYKPDALVWDETIYYAVYAQQMLRGDLVGKDYSYYLNLFPQLNDMSSDASENRYPYIFDRLGPALLALLARVVGNNVPFAFVLFDFIAPFALGFFVLCLCLKIRNSLGCAILATSLFIWFNVTDTVTLINMLRGGWVHQEITFLRTPYPQVAIITFVFFLLAWLHLYDHPSLASSVGFGVALALNVYTYVYSWLLAAPIAGLMLLVILRQILNHRRGFRAALKYYILSLFIAFVLALPVMAGYLIVPDVARDLSLRFGGNVAVSHAPDIKRSILLVVIALPLLLVSGESWRRKDFWLTFWVAGLVVVNQQVITGRIVQSEHWTAYYFETFVMIYAVDVGLALWQQLRPQNFAKYSSKLLVIGGIFVFALGFLVMSGRLVWASTALVEFKQDQDFTQVVNMLNGLDDNSIVYAKDDYIANVLPAFVRQRFFSPRWIDPMSDVQLEAVRDLVKRVTECQSNSVKFTSTASIITVVNRFKENYEFRPGDLLLENPSFRVGYLRNDCLVVN